jgi:hypothetical protein
MLLAGFLLAMICSSEMSVHFYWTTRCCTTEDHTIHSHHCENFRSNLMSLHYISMSIEILVCFIHNQTSHLVFICSSRFKISVNNYADTNIQESQTVLSWAVRS